MSVSPARAATAAAIAYHDVLSDDGTRLRAWTNDPDGARSTAPPCCSATAWAPARSPGRRCCGPDCGVRVISWNHRGTGGSDRPARPRPGRRRAARRGRARRCWTTSASTAPCSLGWSIGVNTMFELAVRHPERALALFAVAGVPGDTFSTMLGPLRVPRFAARALTVGLSRGLSVVGGRTEPDHLPAAGRPTRHRAADPHRLHVPAARPRAGRASRSREFLTTPVDWYAHLALHASRHARVSLSGVTLPTVFVAGTFDLMAGARDMASAAARIEGATYVELRGSHFLQMEQPDRVHALLLELVDRVT